MSYRTSRVLLTFYVFIVRKRGIFWKYSMGLACGVQKWIIFDFFWPQTRTVYFAKSRNTKKTDVQTLNSQSSGYPLLGKFIV